MSLHLSFFKTKVLMDRATFMLISKRAAMVAEMRERLDDERALLLTALHDLAVERQEKEPQLFTRRWLRSHRNEPDPFPIERKGGGARAERS